MAYIEIQRGSILLAMCLYFVAGKCQWSSRDEELHVAQMGAEQQQ
jgi:hypothetical protein